MGVLKVLLGLAVGVGATVAVVNGVGWAADSYQLATNDRLGVVERVIDGDTLDARVAGRQVRIRLLNVDTPETKDPNQPVECLGPEASEFLTKRLPQGTRVELAYDTERLDGYGRTLAGVFESKRLVNAEIAEAGLGQPVYCAPNERFLEPVRQAFARAEAEGRGFFDPGVGCTLTSQVRDATSTTTSGSSPDSDSGSGSSSGTTGWYPRSYTPPGYNGPRCFNPGGTLWRPC